MFCSPATLTDSKLLAKEIEVMQVITDQQKSLTREAHNLTYSQIRERVTDIERIKTFKRAITWEILARGFKLDKEKKWVQK